VLYPQSELVNAQVNCTGYTLTFVTPVQVR